MSEPPAHASLRTYVVVAAILTLVLPLVIALGIAVALATLTGQFPVFRR